MYDVRRKIQSKINNVGYRIKINYKIASGRFVLYMNYRKMVEGISKQQIKHIVTLTGTDKVEDTKRINTALKIRAELEGSIKPDMNMFKKASDKIFLTDYIEQYKSKFKVKKTSETFLWVRNHVIKCFGTQTTLSQIDKDFCERFREYLSTNLPKAASLYFTKFKQVLHKATEDELISEMTFLRRMSIKAEESVREFLDEDELNIIFHMKFKRVDVKNAFLFSCYTGLRYADMANLRFYDIVADKLRIRQQKTKRDFMIKLHPTALEILGIQKQSSNDKVFPKLTYTLWNNNVKKLIQQAGISKNITGHCARHTFGTRAYKATKDIYVVSKLLDHKNVATTQIYAKLVDEDKDLAIDKLADIR